MQAKVTMLLLLLSLLPDEHCTFLLLASSIVSELRMDRESELESERVEMLSSRFIGAWFIGRFQLFLEVFLFR